VRDDDEGPDEDDEDIRRREIEHRGESAGRLKRTTTNNKTR